jgi:hypothetical protein
MQFLSLEPFVPSGSNFTAAKKLFLELGFSINWDQGDYVGFQKDECRFILQNFSNREFAENFMISVTISSVDEFYKEVLDKKLPERFGIRINKPVNQPYGREVNLIDTAGVCWHFVQQSYL